MLKEYTINNKDIHLYLEDPHLPMIIYNSYSNDTSKIIEECHNINCPKFNFLAISNLNWRNEMTPYYEKIFDNEYKGEASIYLKELENEIIPFIIKDNNLHPLYYCIVGYSLAGLFALFTLSNTHLFTRAISCSGSLWYPSFINYLEKNKLHSVDKIYLSLGNKEKNTKNQLMQNVEKNTRYIYEYYKNANVDTIFVLNEGNHFSFVEKRIANAIKWILQ